MFENNLLAGVSGQGGAYSIEDSLRFNDDDSAYLSRTPSVAGDRKTWTWSGWVKRGNLYSGSSMGIFGNYDSGVNSHSFYFMAGDYLGYKLEVGGTNYTIISDRVFRDISSWYHIVFVFDTTQSTASDRTRLYVNGELQSVNTAVYPSQNQKGFVNSTVYHQVGGLGYVPSPTSSTFDGYMAEVNFIDGQALTPDNFGEINEDTGEWSPKAYEGTYGTNGFYLPFNGNANDDSGNGNNWTENNLASTDYMIDTPTNNFATLNPNFRGGEIGESLAEGNLYYNSGDGDENYVCASQSVSSGKWYFEILPSASDTHGAYGFTNADNLTQSTAVSTNPYDTNNGGMIVPDGNGSPSYKVNSTSTSISVTTNSVFGIALDADTGGIEFFENGVSVGSGTITGITNYIPFASMFSGSVGRIGISNFNFGADSSFAGNKTRQGNTDSNGKGDFYYTPPAGYLALCTDNLPAPAIEQPETQFNVVTYAGTGTTNAVSGAGFQPDFVWIKNRSAVASNKLFDVVRGAGQQLESDTTNAEATNSNFSSFDSDGFTVVGGTAYNLSGNNYVAWCWKAGGTAVSNTDGSITSQVSANVDAGFSIVEYTGSGSSGSTVGHGLTSSPDFVLIKSSSHVTNWLAYHSSTPSGYYYFSSTAGLQSASWFSSNTDTFTLNNTYGDANTSGRTYIAYCFKEIEGFSKFGTYTGNGSADGPFIYTGFRPAFVMFKCTSQAGNWIIHDTARNPENVSLLHLRANTNGADDSGANESIDILSNGFKHRGVSNYNANASGQTYIYMAFAEAPLKNSLGR